MLELDIFVQPITFLCFNTAEKVRKEKISVEVKSAYYLSSAQSPSSTLN